LLILIIFAFLPAVNILSDQRQIESPKVMVIEQEGDSVFCREMEFCFEVLDFEFDSCNLGSNRFFVNFRFINKTKQTLLLNPRYISWYDTNSLRPKGYNVQAVQSGESIFVTLESIPYGKRRMNSPGRFEIRYGEKTLEIPIRLKQESSNIIHCGE
jgi:hypothetical protein